MTLESVWNGFRRIDFDFMGRKAVLIFPNEDNRCNEWLFKRSDKDLQSNDKCI